MAPKNPANENMPLKVVHVVAGVLIDEAHNILLAQRPAGKPMAGLWEFVGGKLEGDESPEEALVRELKEELAITIYEEDCKPLTFVSHAYEDFHLIMYVYELRRWHGNAAPQEGQTLAWVKAEELENYPMPAADIPLIPMLKTIVADK